MGPSHHLRVELPYRRSSVDRLLEAVALPLGALLSLRPPRREVAEEQVRALLGEVPARFHRDIVRSALREILRLISGGWHRLDLVPLARIEDNFWRQEGPVLFLSMHHGQWEWLAGILARLRPGALGIARAPAHPLGRRLLAWIRSHTGQRMAHDFESVRAGREQLEAGGLVAFLADQRPPGASRPGTWLALPTDVSRLPEWWCRNLSVPIWTGVLHPGRDSYVLELNAWPPERIADWDRLLDSEFLPLVRERPGDHFGFWHHRLKPRPSRHSPA